MSNIFALTQYVEEMKKEYNTFINESDDEGIRQKYEYYVEALDNLVAKISINWDFNSDCIIEEVLTENFGRNDTQFLGWDGEEIIVVPKNMVTMVKGGFLCILGEEEEFEKTLKEGKGFPIIFKGIDIDRIREFKTLKK